MDPRSFGAATASSGHDKRIALLIDADNVSAKYLKPILDELSKYGTVTIKRIYGDWTLSLHAKWKTALLENSIMPVQQFGYTQGKNATDSAMIIDAMDILYANSVEGFCIVSSDSDFTRLAARLRESGLTVIGMGEKKTPVPFRTACDVFVTLELLLGSRRRGAGSRSASADAGLEGDIAEPTASKQEIEQAVVDIITDNTNNGKATGLGEIGSRLQKRYPDFDVRSYGTNLLSKLLSEFSSVKIAKAGSNVAVVLAEGGAMPVKSEDAEGEVTALDARVALDGEPGSEGVATDDEGEVRTGRRRRRGRRGGRNQRGTDAAEATEGAEGSVAEGADGVDEGVSASTDESGAGEKGEKDSSNGAVAESSTEDTAANDPQEQNASGVADGENGEDNESPEKPTRRRRSRSRRRNAATDQTAEDPSASDAPDASGIAADEEAVQAKEANRQEAAETVEKEGSADEQPASAEKASRRKQRSSRKPKAKVAPEATADQSEEAQSDSAMEPVAEKPQNESEEVDYESVVAQAREGLIALIRERGEEGMAIGELSAIVRRRFKDFRVTKAGFRNLRLFVSTFEGVTMEKREDDNYAIIQ